MATYPTEIEDARGLRVTGVYFVQDYVEIRFDKVIFRFYDLPGVSMGPQTVSPKDRGWRDAVCTTLGLRLTNVQIDENRVACTFGSVIALTSDFDHSNPEHFHFCVPPANILHVW